MKLRMLLNRIVNRVIGFLRGDMEKWYAAEGPAFFRKAGLVEGHTVLDFGTRVGNYAVPAAMVVGGKGLVYAVDRHEKVLRKLGKKAQVAGLGNIKLVRNSGGVDMDVPDNSVDFALLHDILHMMDLSVRQELYKEMQRVLRAGGRLSVYPKHVLSSMPADFIRKMSADDVKAEVENSGFVCDAEIVGPVSHGDCIEMGRVFVFVKKS